MPNEILKGGLRQASVTSLLTVESFVASDALLVPIHELSHWVAVVAQGYQAELEIHGSFPNTLVILHSLGFDIRWILVEMLSKNGIFGSVTGSEVYQQTATQFEMMVTTSAPYILEALILAGATAFVVDQVYRGLKEENNREKVIAIAKYSLTAIFAALPFLLDAHHNFKDALGGANNDISKIALIANDWNYDYRLLIPELYEQYILLVLVLMVVAASITLIGHKIAENTISEKSEK